MSSIFNPQKMKSVTPQVVAPVQTTVDAATDTKKKFKKPTGRGDSLWAGLQNALKKRLGE